MRIGLLVCDHVDEKFVDIAGDYPAMFASLVEPHEVVAFDVVNGQLPSSSRECDAWIGTGSRRSVNDDLEWIRDAATFVRELHEAGRPFVGVCFGHQLLAQALGGRVEPAAGGWGVGAHATDLVQRDGWMDPPADTCRLLYMHQDQVVAIPEDAVVIARTDHCPVAMLRVGRTMLGVQAHPEFRATYIRALLDTRAERIGEDETDAARRSLDAPTDADRMGKWLLRFMEEAA